MRTRKELGAELTRRLQAIIDRVYDEHLKDSGSTYISSFRMRLVHEYSREMEEELREIMGGVGKEYLAVAPEMGFQVRANVSDIEDAIRDFRRAVESVFHENLFITSAATASVPVYEEIPARLSWFGRSLTTQPAHLEYAGQRLVPVLEYRNEHGRVVGTQRL